jgi:hypothetical protein
VTQAQWAEPLVVKLLAEEFVAHLGTDQVSFLYHLASVVCCHFTHFNISCKTAQPSRVSDCCLTPTNFSSISWREQVNFQ